MSSTDLQNFLLKQGPAASLFKRSTTNHRSDSCPNFPAALFGKSHMIQ